MKLNNGEVTDPKLKYQIYSLTALSNMPKILGLKNIY